MQGRLDKTTSHGSHREKGGEAPTSPHLSASPLFQVPFTSPAPKVDVVAEVCEPIAQVHLYDRDKHSRCLSIGVYRGLSSRSAWGRRSSSRPPGRRGWILPNRWLQTGPRGRGCGSLAVWTSWVVARPSRPVMPPNEGQRQATLDVLGIVHTSQDDPQYTQIVDLVSRHCPKFLHSKLPP